MSYLPARRKRTRHDFSLTIINIVFLLLLFYLATGSLIKQNELQTDVPVTKDLPLERLPRPLLLVAADGSLFLDGAPVSLETLPEAAKKATATASFLNILADRTMPGQAFLDVVARVRAAGAPVRIVTLRAADAASAAPSGAAP